MSSQRMQKVKVNDRSFEIDRTNRSQMFFFPKHTPPVTVRAMSREEAERLLDAPNTKDRD